jgi:hypothetical protein
VLWDRASSRVGSEGRGEGKDVSRFLLVGFEVVWLSKGVYINKQVVSGKW